MRNPTLLSTGYNLVTRRVRCLKSLPDIATKLGRIAGAWQNIRSVFGTRCLNDQGNLQCLKPEAFTD